MLSRKNALETSEGICQPPERTGENEYKTMHDNNRLSTEEGYVIPRKHGETRHRKAKKILVSTVTHFSLYYLSRGRLRQINSKGKF